MKKYYLFFVLVLYFPVTVLLGMEENQSGNKSDQSSHHQKKAKPNTPEKIRLSPRIYQALTDWANNELKQRNQNHPKKKKKRRINNHSLNSKDTGDEGAKTFEQLMEDWTFHIPEEIISTIEQTETFFMYCKDTKTMLDTMDYIFSEITRHSHLAFFKQDNLPIWNMIKTEQEKVASLILKNQNIHNNLLKKIKTTKQILTSIRNNPSTDNFDKLLKHYNSFFPNEQSVSLAKLKECIQEQVNILEIQTNKTIFILLQLIEKYYDAYTPLALQKLDEIKKNFDQVKQEEEINFEILSNILADIDCIYNNFTFINSRILEKVTKKIYSPNKVEKDKTKEEEKKEKILKKFLNHKSIFTLKTELLDRLLLEKTKNFRECFNSLTQKMSTYKQRIEQKNSNNKLLPNQDNPLYPLFPEREKLVQEMINDVNIIKNKIQEIKKIISYYYPKKSKEDEKKLIATIIKDLIKKETHLKNEMKFITETQQNAREYIQKGFCPICHKLSNYKCRKCKCVFYCSIEHQQSHWPEHKKRCSSTETLYITANLIRDYESTFFDDKRKNLIPRDPAEFILNDRSHLLKISNTYGPLLLEHDGRMQYKVYFDEGTAHKLIDDAISDPPLTSMQKSGIAFSHLAYTLLQKQRTQK